MRTIKTPVVVALAAVLASGAGALIGLQRPGPRGPAQPAAPTERTASERAGNLSNPALSEPTPRREISAAESAPALTERRTTPEPPQSITPRPPAPSSPAPRVPETVQDPLARVALRFVGADPDAEAYWGMAINDPSLSAHERQDLIEDLNEDGFPDPEHPTASDLPLIVSRIDLIEELAPAAVDKVNWDAFLEAHKDLVNMYVQLTQH